MIRPGTTLWLLGHELRLSFRRMNARRGASRWVGLAFTIGVPIILTAAVGVPLGLMLRDRTIEVSPVLAAIGAFSVITLFTLMLSQTLSAAVEALYERSDLDLLFSSPLDPRRVMTVRFLGVASAAFTIFGYFMAGPIIAIAVLGHPDWLASLVVLAAVALGATGVGLLLASALFRVLGPRRTRTVAQIMAALIGASFFLASQMRNILGAGRSETFWSQMLELARDPRMQLPGLDWPMRAVFGEPLPLLAVVAVGGGLFALSNAILGPRFATDAAAAAGAGRGGRVRAPTRTGAFAVGAFAVTVRKELRLLARDPGLIAQVLLRVLYMLPLGFLLIRNAGQGEDYLVPGGAAALALVAGQVAGSLAWITVSAEDAPDLLASAPAPVSLVRRGKIAAVGLPLAVLLAPFLLPLIVIAPVAGLAATTGCAAAVFATALINVWWQRPGKRSEFRTRRRASWLVTIAELLVQLLIGLATAAFALGTLLSLLGLIPAAMAALILLALRRSDAQIAAALRAAA